ncbi:MAG: selenide, water dikinase SelD, partial [Planctomycetota bacterium]
AAGAMLIVDQIVGLDRRKRQLQFAHRPPLDFDVLSIGVGSVPDLRSIVIDGPTALAIKPMQTFLSRLTSTLQNAWSSKDRQLLRLAVIGAGAAGIELAFCLSGWVAVQFPHAACHVTLVGAEAQIGAGLNRAAARRVARELLRRGVELKLGRKAVRIVDASVELDSGESIAADAALLALPAVGPTLLKRLGLPTDERGFLRTEATLQTVAQEPIFAVGDAGSIADARMAKAGVFAVRQGPVLRENIRRQLDGRTLLQYKPQRRFLKLLNTGDGRALVSYLGFATHNRMNWRWKDSIDRRFIKQYQDYRPTETPVQRVPSGREPMRCLGCGGKVRSNVLTHALARLDIPPSEADRLGVDESRDAAVLAAPADQIAVTVDFFAPPIDDAFVAGRIAALNAASDLFAVGATPTAAVASVTLPVGDDTAQTRLLSELLQGALHEFAAMGASLVGGHTLEGPRLTIGFTMIGALSGIQRCTKGNLQIGDALVLTKPLGTGVLLAAHARAKCKAEWYDALAETLLASNEAAAALFPEFDVRAATDVTGFGLAGHLLEMLGASRYSAELQLAETPLLLGAGELFAAGDESTMAAANRSAEARIVGTSEQRASPRYAALFDPQTSGGLLIAVETHRAELLVDRLRRVGVRTARQIGAIVAGDRENSMVSLI